MNLELWQWVVVVLAALFIGVSKTAIGGLGMVSVAIFANVLPAREASGFVLPCVDLRGSGGGEILPRAYPVETSAAPCSLDGGRGDPGLDVHGDDQ